MTQETLAAFAAFLGTAAGGFVSAAASVRDLRERLDRLERKVDLHNSVVERLAAAEARLSALEKRH